MITFTVPAVPVAQPRPKATTVNGMARMYEAKKSHGIHAFKATARMAAAAAYAGPPLDGPLGAELDFVFASKKSKRCWKSTKPDLDNCAKGLLDALNGTLYKDDGQVVLMVLTKEHAAKGEQPHVKVKITQLPQERGGKITKETAA